MRVRDTPVVETIGPAVYQHDYKPHGYYDSMLPGPPAAFIQMKQDIRRRYLPNRQYRQQGNSHQGIYAHTPLQHYNNNNDLMSMLTSEGNIKSNPGLSPFFPAGNNFNALKNSIGEASDHPMMMYPSKTSFDGNFDNNVSYVLI